LIAESEQQGLRFVRRLADEWASGANRFDRPGEALFGWISVGRSRDPDAGPGTGEVWAVYVAPEHWGRGAGRALWERGATQLSASGFADITLWVFKENRRARRFYEAAGFAPDAGHEKVTELGGASIPEIRLRRLALGGRA
jgi:ribosomal protein S18 acetylase RimI-like enzyme